MHWEAYRNINILQVLDNSGSFYITFPPPPPTPNTNENYFRSGMCAGK